VLEGLSPVRIRSGALQVRLNARSMNDGDGMSLIERYEAIIHDWTCGCGKGQACPNRDGCCEAAEQIAADPATTQGAVETLERIRDHANSGDDPALLAQHELDRIRRARMSIVEHRSACDPST
jgi:hypothetical protein